MPAYKGAMDVPDNFLKCNFLRLELAPYLKL